MDRINVIYPHNKNDIYDICLNKLKTLNFKEKISIDIKYKWGGYSYSDGGSIPLEFKNWLDGANPNIKFEARTGISYVSDVCQTIHIKMFIVPWNDLSITNEPFENNYMPRCLMDLYLTFEKNLNL